MARERKRWTTEELVDFYLSVKDGVSYKEMSARFGRSHAALHSLRYVLEREVSGQKNVLRAHEEAVDIILGIKEIKPSNNNSVVNNSVVDMPVDRYSQLERGLDEAFTAIEDNVLEFIKAEVNERIVDVKQENQRLQKQVDELKQVIEAAKESNLVTSLRRHFGA